MRDSRGRMSGFAPSALLTKPQRKETMSNYQHELETFYVADQAYWGRPHSFHEWGKAPKVEDYLSPESLLEHEQRNNDAAEEYRRRCRNHLYKKYQESKSRASKAFIEKDLYAFKAYNFYSEYLLSQLKEHDEQN